MSWSSAPALVGLNQAALALRESTAHGILDQNQELFGAQLVSACMCADRAQILPQAPMFDLAAREHSPKIRAQRHLDDCSKRRPGLATALP